ncbi:hypothetical protein [Niveibacterium sp.]|uniref:hypothetical protein n=1 Tax=Niveibacterium sp. TaxID=2017444 RepID=UPI0035B4105E
MGAFENVRGVLNFGVPWKTEGVDYVLWPVLAYRLTAPILPARHKSNPLEKAMLGLVRSGMRNPDDMAELLGLDPELTQHITRRLADGYQPALDAKMRLTDYGRKMLDDADEGSLREATGWIFQDPWTGELWDKFVINLPTVPIVGEKKIGSGYAPEIDLGTEGKPFVYTPWIIEPRSLAHVQPQAADILRSVRLLAAEDAENDDEGTKRFKHADIGKVSYLDAAPEAMYCVTALKAHINSRSGDAWSINDPFRPGKESIRMRRALTLRLVEYPFIAERLAKLLGLQHADQGTSLADFFKNADAVAELEIAHRFGSLADRFGLKDRMVELARKRQIMQAIEHDADPEPVLLACGKVAERLMKQVLATVADQRRREIAELLKLVRGKKCFELLGQDTAANIMALGYAEAPRPLLNVDQSKLRHALLTGSESLMPLTLAALLGAFMSDRHPMKALAQTSPNLLADIAAISEGRNPVAHDGVGGVATPQMTARADELAEKTLSLAEAILNELKAAEITRE